MIDAAVMLLMSVVLLATPGSVGRWGRHAQCMPCRALHLTPLCSCNQALMLCVFSRQHQSSEQCKRQPNKQKPAKHKAKANKPQTQGDKLSLGQAPITTPGRVLGLLLSHSARPLEALPGRQIGTTGRTATRPAGSWALVGGGAGPAA